MRIRIRNTGRTSVWYKRMCYKADPDTTGTDLNTAMQSNADPESASINNENYRNSI